MRPKPKDVFPKRVSIGSLPEPISGRSSSILWPQTTAFPLPVDYGRRTGFDLGEETFIALSVVDKRTLEAIDLWLVVNSNQREFGDSLQKEGLYLTFNNRDVYDEMQGLLLSVISKVEVQKIASSFCSLHRILITWLSLFLEISDLYLDES